jgi:hypothetical protein
MLRNTENNWIAKLFCDFRSGCEVSDSKVDLVVSIIFA